MIYGRVGRNQIFYETGFVVHMFSKIGLEESTVSHCKGPTFLHRVEIQNYIPTENLLVHNGHDHPGS